MNAFSPAQAVITAMITPALLILASASLIATALVRLARVVDRVRKLAESAAPAAGVRAELARSRERARLAERAVFVFFVAVACFVLDGFAIALDHASGNAYGAVPLAITVAGMTLMVAGAAAMAAECRAASAQISTEIAAVEARLA